MIRVVANNSVLIRRNGEIGLIMIASRAPQRHFLIAASFFLCAKAFYASCKSFALRKAEFIQCLIAKKHEVPQSPQARFFLASYRALFLLYFAANLLSYDKHCSAFCLQENAAPLVRRATTLRSQCFGRHAPRALSRALQAKMIASQG